MSFKNEKSIIFLSWLCFALADVRDGIGPFLAVYLQGEGWAADEIGYAMTVGGLSALIFTPMCGALADKSRRKRLFLATAVVLMCVACGVPFFVQNAAVIYGSKFLQGAFSAVIAPMLAALTLGLVGQENYAHQLGRNEAFNHFGNALTALLGGIVGYYFGIVGVLYVMIFMGVLALIFTKFINPRDIDHEVARGLKHGEEAQTPSAMSVLLGDWALLGLALIFGLFHLGNAAMLPLLSQAAVDNFGVEPATFTAATILIAQAVMIPVSLLAARVAVGRGFGALLWTALGALVVRGLVAGFFASAWSIVPVQILDGVAAGILGVATPALVARMLHGTGHVNLGLGAVLTVQEIFASLSNSYGGVFAHRFGYAWAFVALAALPVVAGVLFIFLKNRNKKFASALDAKANFFKL